MAIYVTGDTHGSQSHGMYSIDGFMHRFNTTSFPEQKEMGKEDYVIICGDFGGIWDTDRFRVRESPSEKAGLDWLDQKPFTTLFIPGNPPERLSPGALARRPCARASSFCADAGTGRYL